MGTGSGSGGGGSSQFVLGGAEEFRGFGAPVAKSDALSSVSTQPSAERRAAVVLDRVGVGPVPSKLLAELPYPTKSRMSGFGKQFPAVAPQVSSVWFVTRATLPDAALIGIAPVASGVGRSTVPLAP